MSRKDKISIIRSDEFASVEDELAAALDQLELSNARIQALLESERTVLADSPVEYAGEDAEPAVSDAPEPTA